MNKPTFKYTGITFLIALGAAVLALVPALILTSGGFALPTVGGLFSLLAPYLGGLTAAFTLVQFVLTSGAAAAFAFLYIGRFTHSMDYAVIASLLYAFSGAALSLAGYPGYSFLLAAAPLMLLATERLFIDGKAGLLGLSLGLCLLCGSSVTIGLPVVWLCYCFARRREFLKGDTLKKALLALGQWVIAIAIAAAALLPQWLGAMQLSIGAWSDLFWGGAFLSLSRISEIGGSLVAQVFPSLEGVGRGAVFAPTWLPMIGISCGAALLFTEESHRFKPMLKLALTMLLLCAVFSGTALTVWAVIPTLIFAAATPVALTNSKAPAKTCFMWFLAATALWVVGVGILFALGKLNMGSLTAKVSIVVAVVSVMGGMAVVLCSPKRAISIACAGLVCAGTTGAALFISTYRAPEAFSFAENQPQLADMLFAGQSDRLQLPKGYEHIAVPWGRQSLNLPRGSASLSEMAALYTLGQHNPYETEADNIALQNLLSSRYKLVPVGTEVTQEGYSYYGAIGNLDIYQNLYSLPMGIVYTKYIPSHILQEAPDENKAQLALKGIALQPEDIAKVEDILYEADESDLEDLTVFHTLTDCYLLSEQRIDGMTMTPTGFTAYTSFDDPQVVFFSVPYSSTAKCYIDDAPADIMLANGGYMAMVIPEGELTVSVELYSGTAAGFVTIGGLAVGIIYLLAELIIKRKGSAKSPTPLALGQPPETTPVQPPKSTAQAIHQAEPATYQSHKPTTSRQAKVEQYSTKRTAQHPSTAEDTAARELSVAELQKAILEQRRRRDEEFNRVKNSHEGKKEQ